jgi:hypothetical protein
MPVFYIFLVTFLLFFSFSFIILRGLFRFRLLSFYRQLYLNLQFTLFVLTP